MKACFLTQLFSILWHKTPPCKPILIEHKVKCEISIVFTKKHFSALFLFCPRSATDPVGQEVIWALGAGCRDIISLQVAPLHPWYDVLYRTTILLSNIVSGWSAFFVCSSQQPARFSNRCLQTIGRCWPHLRALGVGGAGCGIQGLASLGKRSTKLWPYFYSSLI